MTGLCLVLTTVDDERAALALGTALVSERLAACVNVLPSITSIYRWQDRIETTGECQLVIKTSVAASGAAQRRIAELHPYDTPEILIVAVGDGSPDYLAWAHAQIVLPRPA